MPLDKSTIELLMRLSKLVTGSGPKATSQAPLGLVLPSMSREVSKRVARSATSRGTEAIRIDGEELDLYHQILKALSTENELEHLAERELREQLWDLLSDFFVNHTQFSNSSKRKKRIEQFENQIIRPIQEFTVIIPVADFSLLGSSLATGEVKFTRLTKRMVRSPAGRKGMASRACWGPLIGRTVAVVLELPRFGGQ